jgi:hypothetical protein
MSRDLRPNADDRGDDERLGRFAFDPIVREQLRREHELEAQVEPATRVIRAGGFRKLYDEATRAADLRTLIDQANAGRVDRDDPGFENIPPHPAMTAPSDPDALVVHKAPRTNKILFPCCGEVPGLTDLMSARLGDVTCPGPDPVKDARIKRAFAAFRATGETGEQFRVRYLKNAAEYEQWDEAGSPRGRDLTGHGVPSPYVRDLEAKVRSIGAECDRLRAEAADRPEPALMPLDPDWAWALERAAQVWAGHPHAVTNDKTRPGFLETAEWFYVNLRIPPGDGDGV